MLFKPGLLDIDPNYCECGNGEEGCAKCKYGWRIRVDRLEIGMVVEDFIRGGHDVPDGQLGGGDSEVLRENIVLDVEVKGASVYVRVLAKACGNEKLVIDYQGLDLEKTVVCMGRVKVDEDRIDRLKNYPYTRRAVISSSDITNIETAVCALNGCCPIEAWATMAEKMCRAYYDDKPRKKYITKVFTYALAFFWVELYIPSSVDYLFSLKYQTVLAGEGYDDEDVGKEVQMDSTWFAHGLAETGEGQRFRELLSVLRE